MAKYAVTIEETVSDVFEIEAESLEEAEEIARAKYKSGEIVLEPGKQTSALMEVCGLDRSECTDWVEI